MSPRLLQLLMQSNTTGHTSIGDTVEEQLPSLHRQTDVFCTSHVGKRSKQISVTGLSRSQETNMSKYGIIYIIRNELHPSNVYKIGHTTNSIHDRVRELNRETSNPGKFRICAYFPVTDVTKAEKLCHQTLERMGFARRKEFFTGSINRMLTEVEKICFLFQPKQFISKEYLYEEAMSDGNPRQATMKCNACNGHGKTRTQQGFLSIERSCSNCGGGGVIFI